MRQNPAENARPPEFLFFTQCLVDETQNNGWTVTAGELVLLASCWASSSANESGIQVSGGNDIRIENCTVRRNKKWGLLVNGGTAQSLRSAECLVSGGMFTGNGLGTTNTYDGIAFGPYVSDFTINGVRSGKGTSQRYGIRIEPGCTNYVIRGCRLNGNGIGGLYPSFHSQLYAVVDGNLFP